MAETTLPVLAEKLGMTGDQLQAFLGQNFPATAAALQNLPASMERFQGLVRTFETNLDNYATLEPVSFAPIIWTVIVGGGLMFVAGVWAFAAGRRREVTVPEETKPVPELVGAGTH